MKKHPYLPQIGVRLPPAWLEELAGYVAESKGRFNRSDFIREAIADWLERKRNEKLRGS